MLLYGHTHMNRCFDVWTPAWVYERSHMLYKRKGKKSPFHPKFYGKVRGYYGDGTKWGRRLQYVLPNTINHQSLITLTFVADSVSFVNNR